MSAAVFLGVVVFVIVGNLIILRDAEKSEKQHNNGGKNA